MFLGLNIDVLCGQDKTIISPILNITDLKVTKASNLILFAGPNGIHAGDFTCLCVWLCLEGGALEIHGCPGFIPLSMDKYKVGIHF